ncbi:MAG TPA: hypothetical protein VF868_01390 [Bacteroidia bacterium]|jgi:hypothetical protein
MVKLNHKLKGATIVESMIAMVIIVASVGITSLIFINVLNSDKQSVLIKAELILDRELIHLKNTKEFIDGETAIGNWIMKKSISRYEHSNNLYALSLLLMDENGRLITKRQELITLEQ